MVSPLPGDWARAVEALAIARETKMQVGIVRMGILFRREAG